MVLVYNSSGKNHEVISICTFYICKDMNEILRRLNCIHHTSSENIYRVTKVQSYYQCKFNAFGLSLTAIKTFILFKCTY